MRTMRNLFAAMIAVFTITTAVVPSAAAAAHADLVGRGYHDSGYHDPLTTTELAKVYPVHGGASTDDYHGTG